MIDDSSFNLWKKDEVTVKLFEALQVLKDGINEALQSEALIMSKNMEKETARLLGQRDALDLVLNVSVSDVEKEDDED